MADPLKLCPECGHILDADISIDWPPLDGRPTEPGGLDAYRCPACADPFDPSDDRITTIPCSATGDRRCRELAVEVVSEDADVQPAVGPKPARLTGATRYELRCASGHQFGWSWRPPRRRRGQP